MITKEFVVEQNIEYAADFDPCEDAPVGMDTGNFATALLRNAEFRRDMGFPPDPDDADKLRAEYGLALPPAPGDRGLQEPLWPITAQSSAPLVLIPADSLAGLAASGAPVVTHDGVAYWLTTTSPQPCELADGMVTGDKIAPEPVTSIEAGSGLAPPDQHEIRISMNAIPDPIATMDPEKIQARLEEEEFEEFWCGPASVGIKRHDLDELEVYREPRESRADLLRRVYRAVIALGWVTSSNPNVDLNTSLALVVSPTQYDPNPNV